MKKIIVSSCAFLLLLTLVLGTVAYGAGTGYDGLGVNAANTPTFWIETDNPNPKTGDSVTVTFYVTNNDTSSIMSFNGKITFNPNYFKYDTHSCPAKMNGKVLCYDDEDVTSSSVGFSYADSTGMLIRGGEKNVPFFSVTLTAVNTRASSISISAAISMCTVGGDRIEMIMVQPVAVMLGVTTTTASTTRPTLAPTVPTTSPTANLSAENRLKSLAIAPGMLSPTFSSDFYGYNVELPNEISTIRIEAVPMSDKAIIVGGSTVNKDLNEGYNYFTITVRAENGEERSYSLIVNRLPLSQQPTDPSDVVIISLTDPISPPTESTTPMPSVSQSGVTSIKVEDDDSGNDAMKIVGIVAAIIALFFFGFISGYMIDKGMKEKRAAERMVREREKLKSAPPVQDDFASQMPPQYQQMPSGGYDNYGQLPPGEFDPYAAGYDQGGMNPSGYNPNGQYPNGYDPNGYNPNGANPNGYDPNGNGYNQGGYDSAGPADTFASMPIELGPEDDYYN
ncbi:MAG: cadherin-like beta sandwich domain-containing protein [Clostridia bacterium]|nr:cadherin-like beta sandwich domain-containing protein [Clostridia bacterium]